MLFNFSPDNLEYGLRLAGTQTRAGKGNDALATIEGLRKLPAPLHEDPRIDLAEAAAAASLSDFKRQQAAAAKAAQQGAAQGARLLVARAHLEAGQAFLGLGEHAKAIAASEEAQGIHATAGDRRGVARALTTIAIVRRQQGELAEAKRLNEQILAILPGYRGPTRRGHDREQPRGCDATAGTSARGKENVRRVACRQSRDRRQAYCG